MRLRKRTAGLKREGERRRENVRAYNTRTHVSVLLVKN